MSWAAVAERVIRHAPRLVLRLIRRKPRPKRAGPVVVTLTPSQLGEAARVGQSRNASHRKAGRASRKVMGEGNTSVSVDIDGATAELAVAVALGEKWTGRLFEDIKTWQLWKRTGRDVGRFEVRSTRHPSGCLLLHDRDAADAIFVLAITQLPRVRLIGWEVCRNVRLRKWWRDNIPIPAYLVPQHALRPMAELIDAEPRTTR